MRAGSAIRAVIVQIACGMLIAAAALGVAYFVAPNFLANLTSPPKLLEITPAVFKSEARKGQLVTATFLVENLADRPIQLLGANTSCGCTVVMGNFPIELRPHQSTELIVQMKVQGPRADGNSVQVAHLLVNHEGRVPVMTVETHVLSS